MPDAKIKDLTGELFDPKYLTFRAEFVRFKKGEPNGLESTENRRSLGRHGNQHVHVRYPQVSGSRIFTFSAGGPPGLALSRWWECVLSRRPPRDVCARDVCVASVYFSSRE